MGTSIITDICNALDVEINEEFILVSKDGTKRAVKLTHAGLLVCSGNTLSNYLLTFVWAIVPLLNTCVSLRETKNTIRMY